MTCYCGGNYVCGKHRKQAEQRAKAVLAAVPPKLEANARFATPEDTAFVWDILRLVAGE